MVREGIPVGDGELFLCRFPLPSSACSFTGFHSPLGESYENTPHDV